MAQPAFAQESAIPLSRLTADAVLPLSLGPGAGSSTTALWIPSPLAGTVTPVSAKDNKPGAALSVGTAPCGSIVFAFKSVWVPSCGDGSLARVDPDGSKVSARVPIALAAPSGSIAAGVGSIWLVTDRKGIVSRIDPDSNAAVAEIVIAGGAASVLFANDALWVAGGTGDSLIRVNPHSNEIVETIKVGPKPMRLAAADGAVWTLNSGNGSVSRVDVATNKVVATIDVGEKVGSGEIAAGEGSVWISAAGTPLVRIDPRTNKVAQRFSGDGGGAVLVAHGSVWVAAGPHTTWRLDPKLVAGMRP